MKFIISLHLVILCLVFQPQGLWSQQAADPSLLTIDRLFNSREFVQEFPVQIQWMENGDSYTVLEPAANGGRDIVRYRTATQEREVLVPASQLIPEGSEQPLVIEEYSWSNDESKLLIFTNSERVWRTNTRGDYWLYDPGKQELKQIGSDRPASSLMFTKFSPDGSMVGYVSQNNIYVEDLVSGRFIPITRDGTTDIINGTFDWVYEEELFCKDGFRWSPDGQHIAFWQVDATGIGNFFMIDNTDTVYSKIIPVQYPKAGSDPSAVRIGVSRLGSSSTRWLEIPGDPRQNYLPRMQWVDEQRLLVQQINRKQNEYHIWLCDTQTGAVENIYSESDPAWVDVLHMDLTMPWEMADLPLLDEGNSFIRLTEKDGWRHAYRAPIGDGEQLLLSPGDYDLARLYTVDEVSGYFYVNASPDNSTQRYLYSLPLDGSGTFTRLTPAEFPGFNRYDIAPNGRYAIHNFSNAKTPPVTTLISLPDHKVLKILAANTTYKEKIASLAMPEIEFFQVTTPDGITIDGKMIKPHNFDRRRKYPVLFNVYGEPAGQVATDSWGSLWDLMLAQQGYIIIKMDNRGTPCLKGREWRKSIYRKVGVLNSHDQSMAAREVLKWNFIDSERVAVWGWSGGGSMTLNLMFRYPDVYKTGMSVAPVANQLYYDNIYQERYMGLPFENMKDYIAGSPITYAQNLEGNLLLVHGTGDDNVHYQNTEALLNELIRHNKQVQVMPYPNRSHGIFEGTNTTRHLYTLLTNYLKAHCPPGGR